MNNQACTKDFVPAPRSTLFHLLRESPHLQCHRLTTGAPGDGGGAGSDDRRAAQRVRGPMVGGDTQGVEDGDFGEDRNGHQVFWVTM